MKINDIGEALILTIDTERMTISSLWPNGKKNMKTFTSIEDLKEDGCEETCANLGHHVLTMLALSREKLYPIR